MSMLLKPNMGTHSQKSAADGVRADCDEIMKSVKDAMRKAVSELHELSYLAARGEYEGDAVSSPEKWIEQKIRAIEQSPLYR